MIAAMVTITFHHPPSEALGERLQGFTAYVKGWPRRQSRPSRSTVPVITTSPHAGVVDGPHTAELSDARAICRVVLRWDAEGLYGRAG